MLVKNILLVTCVMVSSLLAGCATNSMTGRNQLTIVSEEVAINKSSKVYSSMVDAYAKDNKISSNTAINERVQKVTNRLVERAVFYRPASQKWKWQVNVIESDDVNAFCMAGGKMAVYTGLLKKVEPTDDELAQVMGHEIAHALANHTAEKMSVQILTNIAVTTAAVAANQDVRAVNDLAELAGKAFVTLPNSRAAETEADKLGIELAAQAGYNPQAAITLWEKMMAATGSKSKGDFFSTHPSSPNRITALEALQAPMQQIYTERAPLYAQYKPTHQYVRTSVDAAGFSSSNVRVIETSEKLMEAPDIELNQVATFYTPEYESFKRGEFELSCHNCGMPFYMKQSELKQMHDKQDWRSLAQSVIKTGYPIDLSYYYLASAAQGLGLVGASKTYFRKAKELSENKELTCTNAKMIKCNGIDITAAADEALR